jgi:hypothetical protein
VHENAEEENDEEAETDELLRKAVNAKFDHESETQSNN